MIIIRCDKIDICVNFSIINLKVPTIMLGNNFYVQCLCFTNPQNDVGYNVRDQTTKEGHVDYCKILSSRKL